MYLKDVARFGYFTGWRLNEVLSLEWQDIDREHGEIRLRPERSKNGHGRIVPLVGDLADLIERRPEPDPVRDQRDGRYGHHRPPDAQHVQPVQHLDDGRPS